MTLEWFVQQGWNGIPASSDQISGTINFGDATTQLNPVWNFIHSYPGSGTYNISYPVQSSYGCADTLYLEVIVQSIPQVDIIATPKCIEKADISAELILGTFELDNYQWQFPSIAISDQLTFEQTFPGGGDINGTLTLMSTIGCEFDFPFQFYVEPGIDFPALEVPNVITANGDGVNDKIEINPLFENCFSYEFTILNRWGSKLFTSNSSAQSFEGKDSNGNDLLPGVYFYTLTSEQGEKHGFITLIR